MAAMALLEPSRAPVGGRRRRALDWPFPLQTRPNPFDSAKYFIRMQVVTLLRQRVSSKPNVEGLPNSLRPSAVDRRGLGCPVLLGGAEPTA